MLGLAASVIQVALVKMNIASLQLPHILTDKVER